MTLTVAVLIMVLLGLGAWLTVFLWVTGLASNARRARRSYDAPGGRRKPRPLVR